MACDASVLYRRAASSLRWMLSWTFLLSEPVAGGCEHAFQNPGRKGCVCVGVLGFGARAWSHAGLTPAVALVLKKEKSLVQGSGLHGRDLTSPFEHYGKIGSSAGHQCPLIETTACVPQSVCVLQRQQDLTGKCKSPSRNDMLCWCLSIICRCSAALHCMLSQRCLTNKQTASCFFCCVALWCCCSMPAPAAAWLCLAAGCMLWAAMQGTSCCMQQWRHTTPLLAGGCLAVPSAVAGAACWQLPCSVGR